MKRAHPKSVASPSPTTGGGVEDAWAHEIKEEDVPKILRTIIMVCTPFLRSPGRV